MRIRTRKRVVNVFTGREGAAKTRRMPGGPLAGIDVHQRKIAALREAIAFTGPALGVKATMPANKIAASE